MKVETFKGNIGTAYGEKLEKEIPFEGTYEAYENYSDVPTNDRLSEKDCLAVVNDARKAAARAEVIEETLLKAGFKKPDAKDPEFQRKVMIDNLMKRKGIDRETATGIIDTILS